MDTEQKIQKELEQLASLIMQMSKDDMDKPQEYYKKLSNALYIAKRGLLEAAIREIEEEKCQNHH